MVSKIKNVKISYPTEYIRKQWLELEAKRDRMMQSSDWILLEDSGLTESSLADWTSWRKQLRNINYRKIKSFARATKELNRLKRNIPDKIYQDDTNADYLHDEIEDNTEVHMDELSELKSDVAKLADIFANHIEQNINSTQNPTDLEEARAIVLDSLHEWYIKSLKRVSSSPITIINERCEQAIEYLVSNDISLAPFVQVRHEFTKESLEECANYFINEQKKIIKECASLEKKFWMYEKMIIETDDVEYLLRIDEQLIA